MIDLFIKRSVKMAGLCGICLYLSCGSNNLSPYNPTTGSGINDAWTVSELSCNGTYTGGATIYAASNAYLTIKTNAISKCSNVSTKLPPTFAVVYSLPSGFSTDTNYQNVTLGGSGSSPILGYSFILNGDSLMTNSLDNFALTLPYDPSKVTSANRTSTKVFVRLFNDDDDSVVDINGTVSSSQITINLYGLPTRFTVAVMYNPYMDTAESTATTSFWTVQYWCVVYNYTNTDIIEAVGGVSPSKSTINDYIKRNVANEVAAVQEYYINDGFTAPLLYYGSSSSDPCGVSNKRYIMYLNPKGDNFASNDPNDIISSAGNKYGRLYINPAKLLDEPPDSGTITAAIADELMYAVADGYEIYSSPTTDGYRKGSATLYGMTVDAASIDVSSYDNGFTKLMSDFVTVNERASDDTVAYANQDFFAYVGKKYNSGSLSYMSGMFNQLWSSIQSSSEALKLQPTRNTVLTSMNLYFSNHLGGTLRTLFLDFLKQRTMEHNVPSQLRPGDPTTGFTLDLFQTSAADTRNSVAEITVDPTTCAISSSSGGFGSVAPYAARDIRITTPSGVSSAAGATVTVKLNIPTGGIGNPWDGFTYTSWNSAINDISTTNTFSAFGTAATDEIDVLVANTSIAITTYIEYTITCAL